MNKLSTDERVRVVSALIEGCSIRSTVRLTRVAKNTIVKLLVELGTACETYHDENVRGLTSQRVQCDEIWSFCYAKDKNVPEDKKATFGYGDVWTWTALDADTKLIIGWFIGNRSAKCATEFLKDVAARVVNRIQLTTDGLASYLDGVYNAFGSNIDHAVLHKTYAKDGSGGGRYSPPIVVGVNREVHCGTPNPEHISTSFVERSNLTIRMSMRRFTRLTNAFSKKLANLEANVALHFMHYNYCRVHQTLRVTPAMQAGLTDHVWEIEELVALLD